MSITKMAKKQKNKEAVTTIPELAKMMRDSFQSNQDLIMGEIGSLKGQFGSLKGQFGSLKGQVGSLRKEIRNGFKQVTEKINNISKNTVDVIHQEDFDKLENRVVDLEEMAGLPVKKS